MKELPNEFRTIIAVLDGGSMGVVPVIGCVVRTRDKGIVFKVSASNMIYHTSAILKWRYLVDVLPDFCACSKDVYKLAKELRKSRIEQ